METLPPTEIRAAILRMVEASIAIRPPECAAEVPRMFGYRGTSPALAAAVAALVKPGQLHHLRGELRLP